MTAPDLSQVFPTFAKLLPGAEPEYVLAPRSSSEICELETSLGIELPASYRKFLRSCGGLWLFGGNVQMASQHPFFHKFPPLSALTAQQRAVVDQRGGIWPPPSDGMLCFAEYFLEADGDQVLFDVSGGLSDGEYPVYYYAHEASPASVTRQADSFEEWIEHVCIQSLSGD